MQPEVEKAVDDIINEAFTYDNENGPVDINLSNVDDTLLSPKLKAETKKEFDKILKMMNFKFECYNIFRNWYVDGRIYFHKVVDTENPKNGIVEIKMIDPRKIRKVKEQVKSNKKFPSVARITNNSIEINKKYVEYYVYNPNGVNKKSPSGIPIAPNSITYIHSGILDKTNSIVLSHLNKAIKIFNALRMLEDAVVIYRISRAPERRVFNIEVGNLPKMKAEQYVSEIMRKHNKKLKYDPETGEVSDDKRIMTMLEDFWFPKRDGKGTTVETLPGGQSLGQIDDVEYFKKKLYEALNVPIGRLDNSATFNLGRSSEITRDELKFSIFVNRLRTRFSLLFIDILGDQLLLKQIIDSSTWEVIKENISIDFVENNHFTELKEAELFGVRMQSLTQAEPYIGKLFSQEWIRTNILKMTEEEWAIMKEQIDKEPPWQPVNAGFGGMPMGGDPGLGGDSFGGPPEQDFNDQPAPETENPEDDGNPPPWIAPKK